MFRRGRFSRPVLRLWAAVCGAALMGMLGSAATRRLAAAEDIDFNRDISPILSENCFACHGFDAKARQADLRLDQAESALAERSGKPAWAPGSPERSEAWRRISSADSDERMPPPSSNHTLTDGQKAKIRQWIVAGAKYAVHWSFVAPKKTTPPEVSRPDWPRGEIDRFVLARLDRERRTPSPEADRRTLIRRVSLDLVGLPPSAEEVEAFVSDAREDAFERVVDRLLASPHFGEKLALDWLDAARYADTNGYSIDGGRQAWLWRDWVIQSFNDNLRYDRFLAEQLAGDLFPNPTDGMLIATGFQRNNMVTHEGGTIPAENLVNYNADRVKTLGEAVLGLTLGCAQCHDHKYDPIPQRDYYRLFAYFNTASDIGLDGNGGVDPRPARRMRTVLRSGEEAQVAAELEKLRERLEHPDDGQIEAWENEQRKQLRERGKQMQLLATEPLKVSTPNRGSGFEITGSRVRIEKPGPLAAYDLSLKLPVTESPITGVRVVFHPDSKAPGGGWGYGGNTRRARSAAKGGRKAKGADDEAAPVDEDSPAPPPKDPQAGAGKDEQASANKDAQASGIKEAQAGGKKSRADHPAAEPAGEPKGNFVLTALSISADAVPGDQVNLYRLLGVRQVTANTWQEEFPPGDCLDMRNEDGWSPDPTWEGPVHLTATFAEPLSAAATPYLTVQLNFGHGKSLVAAQFEVLALAGADDGSPLPAAIILALEKPRRERTAEEQDEIRDYFAAHAEATRATRVAIENLQERLAVATQEFPTMVMDIASRPRDTFILKRGDYQQPGERVTAGTLSLAPALGEAPPNRLGLAEWVTSPANPLTARVAVNRFWGMMFGAGLVRTMADFGAQGEAPTHPELLDWLAVDFVENGWDAKRLVRSIALSAAYRQSSVPSAALLEDDPQNRLLARGPRFRLSAELIRDGALKTSGLLAPRLGGPGVNPYAPGDLWREISHYGSTPATAQTFVQDHGEKLYRRSLYTFWKRTVPPPNMAAFDAPSREVCSVSRPSTNTPLQALVLLNDVQFVEASRAFAERIIGRAVDDRERIRWAFDECLSRLPGDKELTLFLGALGRERERYAAHEDAARAYLANGESPRDESIAPAEHAAWSQIAALLFNLSETVTRN